MSSAHHGLIDRDRAVLVVVDIQERLAAVMPRREETVATSTRLVKAAGVLGIPVLVTRQYPDGLGDTVVEVREAYDALPVEFQAGIVDKIAFCCGEEPTFEEALDATGRGQVILIGMETHICVVQTALGLISQGRSVQVPYDATCSRRQDDHERALNRICAEGGTATTSESVMYEALGVASGPDFKAVLSIVKEG